ncbi:MAG: bifunctional pyr operon transcriptional regulator/uracil phosphoribosyltransferase PyrR [Actinomycetes bacterium]|jgi:pyrimidine operon attenuation protein/uracil phosphoribosyltransferase|nr:bifunctional pyr operon transcriptional regulator/uracil phosphoribosyltransferase PyrR [Actinomycetes bacterium]
MPDTVKASLMNEQDVSRSLMRISHEILEANGGAEGLAIVGIVTRGDIIAHQVAENIQKIEGSAVPVGTLDISLYRDDVATKISPVLHRTDLPFNVDDTTVVLVDDVLFTGRTIRAALDAIMDYGRPNAIQLAVLVDRGHRELPIRADYVGKNVPSSYGEKVMVRLKPVDEVTDVRIIAADPTESDAAGDALPPEIDAITGE